MQSDTQKVEFVPPPSFSPPEGSNDGEFDIVCTFRTKGNKICLVELGDTKMPGYDDSEDDSSSKPNYAGYAQDMQQTQQGES